MNSISQQVKGIGKVMTSITADSLDRDIELQFDGVRGYFTSGVKIVSDIYILKQYQAAVRLLAEYEAEMAKVPRLEATIRKGLQAQFGIIGDEWGVIEYDAATMLDATGRPG
jgi:hypothetical protein